MDVQVTTQYLSALVQNQLRGMTLSRSEADTICRSIVNEVNRVTAQPGSPVSSPMQTPPLEFSGLRYPDMVGMMPVPLKPHHQCLCPKTKVYHEPGCRLADQIRAAAVNDEEAQKAFQVTLNPAQSVTVIRVIGGTVLVERG